MKRHLRAVCGLAGLLALVCLGRPAQAAIGLVRFAALAAGQGVMVEWETAAELYTAGFFLQRGPAPEGDFTRVSGFIPAQGGGLIGAAYRFEDPAVTRGTAYYYVLEVVAADQSTELFGPVSVTVDLPPSGTPPATPLPADTAIPPPATATIPPSATATLTPSATATIAPPATAPAPAAIKTRTPDPAPSAAAARSNRAVSTMSGRLGTGENILAPRESHPAAGLSPTAARAESVGTQIAPGAAAAVLRAGGAVLLAAACGLWAWLAADLARAVRPRR